MGSDKGQPCSHSWVCPLMPALQRKASVTKGRGLEGDQWGPKAQPREAWVNELGVNVPPLSFQSDFEERPLRETLTVLLILKQ